MKNFLRRWLEIPTLPEVEKQVDADDVAAAVERKLRDAFTDEFMMFGRGRTLRGTVHNILTEIIKQDIRVDVHLEVTRVTKDENFISDIVNRITEVQLP